MGGSGTAGAGGGELNMQLLNDPVKITSVIGIGMATIAIIFFRRAGVPFLSFSHKLSEYFTPRGLVLYVSAFIVLVVGSFLLAYVF
jgi:hypothetical protein